MHTHVRAPRATLLLTIAVFGGAALWATWVNASFASRTRAYLSTANEGQLVAAAQAKHNFGTISMADGTVRHDFTVKNSGRTVLTLNKLYTTCACLGVTIMQTNNFFGPSHAPRKEAEEIDAVLLPGESATLSVAFDPEAHGPAGIGKIVRKVGIEYGALKPLTFRISAFVTP